MSSPLLLLLAGLLYVLFFGGLSLFRREGLSARFAIESVIITAVVSGLSWTSGFDPNPVLFLAFVYLVTMRVRLLVDLGNALARGGHRQAADSIYRVALRVWPDETGGLIVRVNQGVLSLHNGQVDEAVEILRNVLAVGGGFLGIRYECGCHYNLGVAYTRKGMGTQASHEFNAVLDIWPASEYARHAQQALERRKVTEDERRRTNDTDD